MPDVERIESVGENGESLRLGIGPSRGGKATSAETMDSLWRIRGCERYPAIVAVVADSAIGSGASSDHGVLSA
jgi:hypothetical protein